MRRVLFDRGGSALGAGFGPRSTPIRAVHTGVPGRTRFKVASLYRCPGLKRHLERSLGSMPGIRVVEANILTGNLLVLYAPRWSVGWSAASGTASPRR